MAVITELIEAGIKLKRSGNLRGAIEHFKQLHATYPRHARIMFELAAAWREFGVPEQALPLYRELLALPKSGGLPPKDMPRLYTQLGATLLESGEIEEALATIEDGLRLHPSYRSLRAWRIFALAEAGSDQLALLDALELMLESLAPSRWDIFEDDVKALVKQMRARLRADEAPHPAAQAEPASQKQEPSAMDAAAADAPSANIDRQKRERIDVSTAPPEQEDFELAVNLVKKAPRKQPSRKRKPRPQMGKRAVRINISGEKDETASKDADANPPEGSLKIPIDPD